MTIPPLHKINWKYSYSLTGVQVSRWIKLYPRRSVFLWRVEGNDNITYNIVFHTFHPGFTESDTWSHLDPITAQAVIHHINENLLPGEVTDEAQK